LRGVAAAALATFAWWCALLVARRPALNYFCVDAFVPLVVASVWLTLAWGLLTLLRRYSQPCRPRLWAVTLLALLLVPYSLVRAGRDMFTLSLRYHLWRAGGADTVRGAFNGWVASRPVYDPGDGSKLLFARVTPGGNIVRLPATQLPAEIRYIDERFPSRFGTTRQGVAYLDNVYALTTTSIMIGPAGWEPEGGATILHHLTGSRRKLADGIWVGFGLYDK
jgi:hypothetical protein